VLERKQLARILAALWGHGVMLRRRAGVMNFSINPAAATEQFSPFGPSGRRFIKGHRLEAL
jgi:hypothetical protein